MEHLKPPTEMVFSTDDGSSIAEKWRCWRQAMELYLNLSIPDKSDKEKCAVFLYVIGSTGRDIYNSMVFGNDEKDKINVLFKKFEDYCKPKQNIAVERYKFNMRLQDKSETIDQFVTALRLLAKECNFKELHDELIRDRIVCGITSDRVKERLLREQDLTLDKAIHICRAEEVSKKQMKCISEEAVTDPVVHAMKHSKRKYVEKTTTQNKTGSQKQSVPGNCHNCGTVHPKRKCPAYGKKCLNCGKFNHFAKWCRSRKKIDTLSKKEEAEDLRFIGALGKGRPHSSENECFVNLEIHGLSVRLKIDTGSQANILPWKIFKKLSNKPELQQSSTKLTTYSGDTLSIVGRCNLSCQDKNLESGNNLLFLNCIAILLGKIEIN